MRRNRPSILTRGTGQLSELLAEKESVLSEALKRQGQLIEEMEELEAEKKRHQREAERLKLQGDKNQATLREMQASLEEQADAMAFSEKMLMLSREQTESLHAMRESLRDKEEVVAQKVPRLVSCPAFVCWNRLPCTIRASMRPCMDTPESTLNPGRPHCLGVWTPTRRRDRDHGHGPRGPLEHEPPIPQKVPNDSGIEAVNRL